MQNRITKSCQNRRNRRADRLRELLQLSPGDSVLLDACKRKKAKDGSYTLLFLNRKPSDNMKHIQRWGNRNKTEL